MQNTETSVEEQALQLKGSLFTLTVLQIQDTNIEHLTQQLKKLTTKTPKFFQHLPVVLDVQKLVRHEDKVDFVKMLQTIHQYSLIPIGVRGGTTGLNQIALEAGLAIMPTSKFDQVVKPEVEPAPQQNNHSKVVTHPVRSGQQIYAKQGDLIVLAPVSSGAELIADGNIHIYAPLRGRALAGANGDESARIFCHELDADLIAIAGHYILKDDIRKIELERNKIVHIYLENGRLRLNTL